VDDPNDPDRTASTESLIDQDSERTLKPAMRKIATDRDPLLVHVAEQIVAARQKLGITQDQLAEKAGCAPLTVTHVESGRRNMTLKSLSLLATALGVDISDLFPRAKSESDQVLAANVAEAISDQLGRIASAVAKIESIIGDKATRKLP
jgi:transcriptional regulator with XRE-family HTH domain